MSALTPRGYEFGDFRFDVEERTLIPRDGPPVLLTPRVFQTLRYLVEHAGRVAEKQSLMDAVWPDCVVEENNLAQNISTLRRIFGDKNGASRYIATVPGRGYRFLPEVRTSAAPQSPAPVASSQPNATAAGSSRSLPAGVALVLLLIGVAAFLWWRTTHFAPPPEKSIAVLPFTNLSEDPANAYFAEGIKDEILTQLSKIDTLKVTSRTSTDEFTGQKRNLKEIARRLGVAYVVEGSLQRSGDHVRVTVQLIEAATDHHLWAETYDRPLLDLFEVETEVAEKVATSLDVKLGGVRRDANVSPGTKSRTAFEAYLRGLTAEEWFDFDSWQRATDAFEEAVRADPQFAKAWAALARVRARTCFQGLDTTEAARRAAKAAVENALRLEPDMIEAKIARGFYEYYITGDYETARRIFEETRQEWRNNAEVVATLGFIAFRQGRWPDGRALLDEAIALSPRDCYLRGEAAYTRACVRDFPGALRAFDQALAVCGDEPNLTGSKAAVYQVLGELEQAEVLLRGLRPQAKDMAAIAAISHQAMLRRDPAAAIAMLRALSDAREALPALVQARQTVFLGQLEELAGNAPEARIRFLRARELLEKEEQQQPHNALLACLLAQSLAGLGEREAALREINRAIEIFPTAKDARDGPYYEAMKARLEARFGEGDHAIPVLRRLLETSYSAWPGSLITPAILRFHPDFDPLRSDPRFRELCGLSPEPESNRPAPGGY